jgi:hypothetical protein
MNRLVLLLLVIAAKPFSVYLTAYASVCLTRNPGKGFVAAQNGQIPDVRELQLATGVAVDILRLLQ